jgi:hypothetical protein
LDELPKDTIASKVDQVESVFEIPFQYATFEDPFLLFLVSPSDVLHLYRLVSKCDELPRSCHILGNVILPEDIVFWAKTYPQNMISDLDDYRRLLFPKVKVTVPRNEDFERRWRSIEDLSMDRREDPLVILDSMKNAEPDFRQYALLKGTAMLGERAESFERYLIYELHLQTAVHWMEICHSHQQFILAPILATLAADAHEPKILPTFQNASKWIRSRGNLQFLYLMVLSERLPAILEPYRLQLADLRQSWSAHLTRKVNAMEKLGMDGSAVIAAGFFEATERIRIIKTDPLPFQFKDLMRSLSILHQIAPGEAGVKDTIKLALLVCYDVVDIIELALILTVFGMHVEEFRDLCLESEILHWIHFEAVIVEFAMENSITYEMFSSLQPKLGEEI